MNENNPTAKKNDTKQIDEQLIVPKEEVEAHPELSVGIAKEKGGKKRLQRRKSRAITQEMVDRFNRQKVTNGIIAATIFLTVIYFSSGIFGILSLFGFREENSWLIFTKTAFLGWHQLKVTSFVLLIISIIMLWATIYYFRRRNQEADSFLIIGSGLGSLFGIIYLFVILADLLKALVESATNAQSSTQIETYFYLPILLAFFTLPLFRILMIRHTVILPPDSENSLIKEEEEEEEEEEEKLTRNRWLERDKKRGGGCGHRKRRGRKWRDS